MMDSGVIEIATNMSRREPKTRKVREGDQNSGNAGTGRVLLIELRVFGEASSKAIGQNSIESQFIREL
jgi:hypothetical protein